MESAWRSAAPPTVAKPDLRFAVIIGSGYRQEFHGNER